jgi:hypothetical protein
MVGMPDVRQQRVVLVVVQLLYELKPFALNETIFVDHNKIEIVAAQSHTHTHTYAMNGTMYC